MQWAAKRLARARVRTANVIGNGISNNNNHNNKVARKRARARDYNERIISAVFLHSAHTHTHRSSLSSGTQPTTATTSFDATRKRGADFVGGCAALISRAAQCKVVQRAECV